MFPASSPRFPLARRLGAVTLTPDLNAAATALVAALASSCPTTPFDDCSTFQQAYVTAGGSWTDLSVKGTAPDGLYGPSTQNALQSVLDAMGNGGTAPNACVGAGTTVPSLSPTVPLSAEPAVVSPGSIAIGPWVVSQNALVLGTAAAIALALVGSAIYKHYADQDALSLAYAPTRRMRPVRRRKNPTRARRARAQARVRAEGAVRNRKGQFVRGGMRHETSEEETEE